MLQDGVRVRVWPAAVWIEVTFGRLSVTSAQASWLAQAGRDGLIDHKLQQTLKACRN